ncbi:SAM-dependent methyltransferase, partial [Paenarthrobacter aurescens]|nr:SAM-dependent methyltransferase [Paenarthrobacter aurescens]
FPGSTYADQDEEISYIWQSDKGDDMYSVIHDLSFFVKDGDVYQRYDETHEQRTFPFETYAAFLESAGFEQIEVTADFTNEVP